mgnify:CR=1 FL=1
MDVTGSFVMFNSQNLLSVCKGQINSIPLVNDMHMFMLVRVCFVIRLYNAGMFEIATHLKTSNLNSSLLS